MGVSELRELRQLRDESKHLKRIVTELTLDKHILQEVLLKKSLKAARKRELAAQIVEWYEVSVRHACGLLALERSVFTTGAAGGSIWPFAFVSESLLSAGYGMDTSG